MFKLDGLIYEHAKRPDVGCRVSVARLTLSAFRCYAYRRLDLEPQTVVLTGPNGSGKTTILEALSLLAPGRGLRRARLDELKREDRGASGEGKLPRDGAWAVAARLRTPSGEVDVGTGLIAGSAAGGRERRHVRIDAQPARAQSALAAVVGVTWLTPEMDRLFAEGTSARRRFLDRLVFGLDPDHVRRVNAYETAMQERSRLLRQGPADPAWLSALEETMAAHGVAVAAARRDIAERLSIEATHAGAFPGAELDASGTVETWLAENCSALDAECRLREALEQSRPLDAEAGGASVGPHKSNLVVRHALSGRPARACSTGEQKTLLIAIVLASARLQEAERGTAPLLLLDEVAAHLDARHREALFAEAAALRAQAWYAGTDRG
ncbi:MAG: DNA replication/repair protein RecF, partial [Rhodoplanes sp.]